jgi:DNA-binding NarL/FixJ family response regulator
MPEEIIRIALVDDQKLFRRGLRSILSKQDQFQVAFEAENGEQFLERLKFEPVDVVILDVEMEGMGGMETLEVIRKKHSDLKVLMLTMHESERLISHLMKEGANGFLLKDEEPEIVCEAIKRVHQEGIFFRDYVSKALLRNSRQGSVKKNDLLAVQLSDRELQILQLLCKERTSQEIGDQLFISARTVDGHRRKMQDKTGSRNLAGLVLYAVKNGII